MACQLESVGASPNCTNIEANLQIAQTFGSINWIPKVTGQACGAVTTGAKTLQGLWSISTTTGEVTIIEAE